MLTAIRDIGSLFRSETDDPILSRLDALDPLGRPLTVILDLFTASSSFQITFEGTASDPPKNRLTTSVCSFIPDLLRFLFVPTRI